MRNKDFGWLANPDDTRQILMDIRHDKSIPGEKYPAGKYSKQVLSDMRHESYCVWLDLMTKQKKLVPH